VICDDCMQEWVDYCAWDAIKKNLDINGSFASAKSVLMLGKHKI